MRRKCQLNRHGHDHGERWQDHQGHDGLQPVAGRESVVRQLGEHQTEPERPHGPDLEPGQGLRRYLRRQRLGTLREGRDGQGGPPGVNPPPPRLSRQESVMGTLATVEVCDPVPDHGVLDQVFAWLHEVDRRFSTYKEDSEVNRLHRGELTHAHCSADLRYVLDQCARLWQETDGYFDVYATGRLDPSGYVKGWSVQRASELLTAAGATNHLVDAGGDIQTRGQPEPDRPWEIGIRHPWELDKVAWVLAGADLAVATSGTYERGLHVINPRTGQPATALRSVTVRSEEHTSELQSLRHLVCRLLLEKKKNNKQPEIL